MYIKNIFKTKIGIKRLIDKVQRRPIPKHIAIIMDGNGRWAQERGMPREVGHRHGSESVKEIVELSKKLGIEHLTLFAFSTENWQRPQTEIDALMDLLIDYLKNELDGLDANNIKINILGDLTEFSSTVQDEVNYALQKTSDNTGLNLNIALNYGGRADILSAVKAVAKDIAADKLSIEELDEVSFSKYLYTGHIPDPDLLIRTSGEYRISNFLLYQIAYTELWFSKPTLLWPDFNQRDLLKVIIEYQGRQRKFGGLI